MNAAQHSGPASASAMTQREARVELRKLVQEINHHDRLYYQMDAPEISDEQYDALRVRLNEIEEAFPDLRRADSPSQRVGAPAAEGFKKIRHRKPMLSLANAFGDEDVREFDARVRKFLNVSADAEINYALEHKIDGL